ncbi:MAG: restriction endonuclease subunit S [Methanosarcinales archaeon]|nr:restriction endonuclease subunit S [Methanosarcinales archaeon]
MIKTQELPDGWEIVELKAIFEIKKGKKVKIEETVNEKSIPYIGIGNLRGDPIVQFTNDEKGLFCEENDILLVWDGANCGTVGYGLSGYVGSTITRLRLINDTSDSDYILHFLKSKFHYFNSNTTGATIPHLDKKRVHNLKIPLPPLPTQKKIVAILEKAEKLKGWRREADELTDELLKSTFFEMFGDPVKNHNGWKVVKLQDVSEIVSGVTKGRKLSGKEVISVPYLRVANVQDGYLELNEIKLIEVLPSDVEKFALKEGDVLLTEGGDPDKLGRGSVWHDEIPNCIHQNHIFRVRVNKKHLIPEYLSMLIGSPYGKMYFLKSAKQTTGIASINSKQLKNFPALIPPLELQNKLAKIIRQTEQLREQQKQSRQHIDDLFNALMQQAFRGELTT